MQSISVLCLDPVVPDVYVRLRIPYVLTLLLGLTIEWLRRQLRHKRRVGFTILRTVGEIKGDGTALSGPSDETS